MPNSPTNSRANAQACRAATRRAFFSTLAGLGATAFAAGLAAGFLAAGLLALEGAFAMSVHGTRARQHRSRSRPADGARAAGGAPGERKATRTEQGGVRDGRRRSNGRPSARFPRQQPVKRRAPRRRQRGRGARYVQEVRINACAAPRRVAAHARSTSHSQRACASAPEPYRLTRHAQVHRP